MTSDVPESGSTGSAHEVRASDADREAFAAALRDAAVEGRLGMDELDERLDVVYKARTYAELEPVTRDLPAHVAHSLPGPAVETEVTGTNWPARIGGAPTSSGAIGLIGGFNRTGRWTVARRFTVLALCGGGRIDLREANFESRETVIRCFAILGGIGVVVPPGVEVVSRGVGVMGGFDTKTGGPGDPGAPRVIVTGFAFWGGVGLARKRRKAEKERLERDRREQLGEGAPPASLE